MTVLSADQENDADILGVVAASTALSLSPVPGTGPSAPCAGRVEGNWILNPTFQQLEFSTIDLVERLRRLDRHGRGRLARGLRGGDPGGAQGGAEGHPGHDRARAPADGQGRRQAQAGWVKAEIDSELQGRAQNAAEQAMAQAINAADMAAARRREGREGSGAQHLLAEYPERGREISNHLEDIEYRVMRKQVLERGERVDGRDLDTIRPISIETGVLPRTHGSALFTWGQTQALVSVTLGTTDDEQRIDSIDVAGETTKSFMLHYNFPPYSTGEVKMIRGTSRREIGHGALAERALQPLPQLQYEDFYTARVVSEVLESNGSSSMATVCGGSLALMDAGVPMKASCAGVAMGLIKEADKVAILTDIRPEDHLRRHGLQGRRHRAGHHLDPDGHQGRRARLQDHGAGAGEGTEGPAAHPEGDGQGAAGTAHRASKYAPRIFTMQIKPTRSAT